LLPASLWGASFPLALAAIARRGQDPGRLVGGVYAANTIGAVAGALAASLLLVAWIGSQHAQRVMMVISAAAGALVLVPPLVRSASRSPIQFVPVAAGLAATLFFVRGVPPIPAMLVAHGRFAATLFDQAGEIIYVG